MAIHVLVDQKKLAAFCQRWKVIELAVFDSVMRTEEEAKEIVDVLVTFAPETHYTFGEFFRMEEELSTVFGKPVAVTTRGALEDDRNSLRRKAILESLQTIYAE
jgi:predicted nucleotidyltransferase